MALPVGFLINAFDFDGKLGEALDGLRLRGDASLEVMATKTVATAKSLAPVGSDPQDIPGLLRDSLTASPIQHATSADAYVEIYSDVSYAAYVEYGTSDMPPQPFLRPAMHQAKIEAP